MNAVLAQKKLAKGDDMKEKKQLNFFDRYLSLWVLLCIGIGIAFGKYFPGFIHTLGN